MKTSPREETKADYYTIAITEQQSQDPDYSTKSETPNNKSNEEAKLFHTDPHHPERVLQIRMKHPAREKTQFEKFLYKNLDVFAWSPTDMLEVNPSIFCHKLSIRFEAKLVKQKS